MRRRTIVAVALAALTLIFAAFAIVVAPALFGGDAPGALSHLPGLAFDQRLGRTARAPARTLPLVESDGTLTLSGDAVLVIDGEHRVHRGDIVLRDRARLEIRDAVLDHVQGHAFEFTLEAHDDASVTVVDSEIRSSDWLNWNFHDRAQLRLDHVEERESRIWHWCTDGCAVEVSGSKFHGTIDGSARASIADSPAVFVEYVWPAGVGVDESLPSQVDDYVFPNANDSGVPFHVEIHRSRIESWGITMRDRSDVTLRDADGLTVTLLIAGEREGLTAELDGLRARHYDDQTWRFLDSSLRLVNTRANPWSPIVGSGNTLVIRDSELADQAFSAGDGHVVIERSSLSTVRARDQVEIDLRDSAVAGDVVAQDDGRVVLERTTVGGTISQRDRGSVVVRQ